MADVSGTKFEVFADGIEFRHTSYGHSTVRSFLQDCSQTAARGPLWLEVERHGLTEYVLWNRIGRVRLVGQSVDF